MSDLLFIPGPYFILRAPLWPVEKWKEIIEEENWEKGVFQLYDENQEFREAIAIASSSLHNELAKGEKKRTKPMAQSLLKYALRMSSRSTPFGLFSFVAVGKGGEKSRIELDLSKVQKQARPDMGWFYAFIQKTYNEKNAFPSLSVYTNPLISSELDRFSLSYHRKLDKTKLNEDKTSSIEATLLTSSIFKIAKTDVTVAELCKGLEQFIDPFDLDQVLEVINELFKEQFLLPSPLPSLLSSSPFRDGSGKFPNQEYLKPLIPAIDAYNNTSIGEGEDPLRQIYDVMESCIETTPQIQVDSYLEETNFTLSKLVHLEAAQAASLLWKLTPKNSPKEQLRPYHTKFLQKYGMERTVPLLEMINEVPEPSSLSPSPNHLEKWLRGQWYDQIGEISPEIILTDEIVEKLKSTSNRDNPQMSEALPSTDLFCRVIADSQKEIDEGNFLLIAGFCTSQGGSSLGRFSHLFSDTVTSQIRSFYETEEDLDRGAFFVETSSWPIDGSHANVSSMPCMRRYRLDLSERKKERGVLSLEDIYVGADFEGLYLTTKEGGMRLNGCSGNLLRNDVMPKPIQFIRSVTLASSWRIETDLWGSFSQDAEFLPRIRYKKTILSPATWKIHGSLFKGMSKGQLTQAFSAWAVKRRLPRQCMLVHRDMNLLIDREHPAQIEELVKKLSHKETIIFTEYLSSKWCKTTRGNHLSEVVFPLLKNPKYRKPAPSPAPAFESISVKDRMKIPGSEWISYKFYLGEKEVDSFVIHHLQKLGKALSEIEGVVGWFFIRYFDPEFHIRFRVRSTSPDLFGEIIDRIRKSAENWLEKRYINDVLAFSYEREIERYGGLDCLEVAEALFCADSACCCQQIEAFQTISEKDSHVVNNTLSILAFLEGFSLDESEKTDLLHTGDKHKESIAGFRAHKEKLMKGAGVHNILSESIQFMRPIQQYMVKSLEKKTRVSKLKVYASLLHMHCNRLGCDRTQERQACAYARETLKQLRMKKALDIPSEGKTLNTTSK